MEQEKKAKEAKKKKTRKDMFNRQLRALLNSQRFKLALMEKVLGEANVMNYDEFKEMIRNGYFDVGSLPNEKNNEIIQELLVTEGSLFELVPEFAEMTVEFEPAEPKLETSPKVITCNENVEAPIQEEILDEAGSQSADGNVGLYKCNKCTYASRFKYHLARHVKTRHHHQKRLFTRKISIADSIWDTKRPVMHPKQGIDSSNASSAVKSWSRSVTCRDT
jgi:hypothetical protein